MEGLQRFRHRGLRIRPVGEVEVDIIGIQATQRVVNRLLIRALLSPLWPGRPRSEPTLVKILTLSRMPGRACSQRPIMVSDSPPWLPSAQRE